MTKVLEIIQTPISSKSKASNSPENENMLKNDIESSSIYEFDYFGDN